MRGFSEIEEFREISSDSGKTLGYTVIHSTIAGRAYGGTRMLPDITPEEMRALAKTMSLKYGFAGIPMGGAKCGIIAEASWAEKERRKAAFEFGKKNSSLISSGKLGTGYDMGCTSVELKEIINGAGLEFREDAYFGNSGDFTALSVSIATEEIAKRLGMGLKGLKFCIEGFGSVGSAAAVMLERKGAIMVGASTIAGAVIENRGMSAERLLELRKIHGDGCVLEYPEAKKVEKKQLFSMECDIFIPCARSFTLDREAGKMLETKALCPATNAPFSENAENVLEKKGVFWLPDFTCNCGGVIGTSISTLAGKETAERFIELEFRKKIRQVLQSAASKGADFRKELKEGAESKFMRMKKNEWKIPAARLFFKVLKNMPYSIRGRIVHDIFYRRLFR